MPVLTVPRRIFLYWLLLLVPTLAVGLGAILLLRREEGRLAERGAYAEEARRAAVTARARLIAENVELLVGDVENGLLDTLAAEPPPGIDDFLEQLEKTNPLVRIAFRAGLDGQVLRPDGRTASEDARGFLRRFARQFGARPPWSTLPIAQGQADAKRQQEPAKDEAGMRQEVSKNVAQVQSARRDVQELFKNSINNYASVDQSQAPAPVLADAFSSRERAIKAAPSEADRRVSAPAAAPRTTPTSAGIFSSQSLAGGKVNQVEATPTSQRSKDAVPDRRGWVPVAADGRLQLVGWVQPGGSGEVRGVEIQIAELVRRLAGALPAEVGRGEGYALRDDQGRILHQSWAIPRSGEPAINVPLAAALLPGWDVVAYLTPTAKFEGGTGIFGIGVLLVAIFVAAILAGGSLLLRQARRSEEEATQKTSFVANVSHEFKTPLTTIRLYSELLEQGRVRDAAQGGEYLRTIGRETQRLARLVNNALDFSRLEQGKKKYASESVDLSVEVGRFLDTHAPRIAETGLSLRRDLPSNPVPVTTDRDALEQIVLNLIDNACKYAADGGEIVVAVNPGPDRGGEVRVSDRGPGVPEEHRERIFEKFHRVDDALTAEKTGAGLGLSIARQLARGLGGELRFAPRDGGGAEFILEIP